MANRFSKCSNRDSCTSPSTFRGQQVSNVWMYVSFSINISIHLYVCADVPLSALRTCRHQALLSLCPSPQRCVWNLCTCLTRETTMHVTCMCVVVVPGKSRCFRVRTVSATSMRWKDPSEASLRSEGREAMAHTQGACVYRGRLYRHSCSGASKDGVLG